MHYIEFAVLIGILVVVSPLMGKFLARLFNGETTRLHPLLGGLEKLTYRLGGVNPHLEMNWKSYIQALFLFNLTGLVVLFALLLFQSVFPLNPQHLPHLSWPLAFNTAVSFVTNTNWQAYSGEVSLSYFSDMLGLTVQNFLSAATGFCALLALIRGISRKETEKLGNFWVDLSRTVIYILLPLSLILALLLVSQGVIQNLGSYVKVQTVEGLEQVIPMGPAASQVAIKQLGTNGGGFFGANSAHPFENPTPLANGLELLAILFLPMALIFTYGELANHRRHAWILWSVVMVLWLGGLGIALWSERLHIPLLEASPLMEGKESRLGLNQSVLWASATTATANGSVNSMLASMSPLAGGVALFNMMVGELIFGGVGVGLISLLMYVLLTVFLAGLMVGRTPEYLGKKIETKEIFWVMFAIFLPSALILVGTAFSLPMSNSGPHTLSEILYAFTSAAQNNGSSFASLDANTTYYNVTLGIVMLLGRVAILLPALKIADLLGRKKHTPSSSGTFSVDTFLFAILLLSIIFTVGALTFFPLLSLGPIVEHFLMLHGWGFV